jgi:YidC/Oxa1 family membrane protein insertase
MIVASIFQTLIVEPIFNLLVLIYSLVPGHNFGLSIIIFTIVVRLLMWPLVRKQLHQAKAMRELQPELKRIKQATKGDRQKESAMLMELYKERGVSPFGSIGTLAIQLVILIGLYSGLNRVVHDPRAIIDFSYSALHNLAWLKELAADIGKFDATLFGVVDLKRSALVTGGGFYYPALIIVLGSAVAQYFQSKQLMPQPKDSRSLRTILRQAGEGKQADQGEVNAAVGRGTRWLLPIFIIFFTIGLPAALGLYWLVTGMVAYWQQARILGQDETEMEALADGKAEVIEGEVVEKKESPKPKSKKKSAKKSKRRKK